MIRKLAFTVSLAAAGLLAAALPASALTWPEADKLCKPGLASAGYNNMPDDSGGTVHCHPVSAAFGGAKPSDAQRAAMGNDVSNITLVKIPAAKPAATGKAKAKTKAKAKATT